jgi:hypothetical protein
MNCTHRRVFLTITQIEELERQLEYYKHHFPGFRDLVREHRPRGNSSASEHRANGGRDPNPVNPLPLPPKPMRYPFTAHNPNFVPPGNAQEPYLRKNIPPVPSQPYVYQVSYPTLSENKRVDPMSSERLARVLSSTKVPAMRIA